MDIEADQDKTQEPSSQDEEPKNTNDHEEAPKDALDPKQTASKMFLSKPLINPYRVRNTQKLKDYTRKHKTFVKIKLVKITAELISDQETEVIKSFRSVMEKIWELDAHAMAMAWKEESTDKPLKKNSEFPKSKEQLTKFVERLWIERTKNAYCKMLITHDEPSDKIFNDDRFQAWLYDSQLSLSIERIQARRITKAGHFMGYHALVANTTNLADAIEQQPIMRGMAVEIRSEFVVLNSKNNSNIQRTKYKILQVYVAWDKASRARNALITLYSSKAKGEYPLGTQARFIPDVTDSRFIRTPECAQAFSNSQKKHIQFMTSTSTHSYFNIIELDHFLPRHNMTLREAITHIFSVSKTSWPLFVAVDTSFNGDRINFAFRTELYDEAVTMISALPIFLEAHLSSSVWNWFTRDARNDAQDYTWDMDRGLVSKNEATHTDTHLESWEQLDDIDDDPESSGTGKVFHNFTLDVLRKVGTPSDQDSIITKNLRTRMVDEDDAESTTSIGDSVVIIDSPGTSLPSTVAETTITPSTLTNGEDNSIAKLLTVCTTADPALALALRSLILQNPGLGLQAALDASRGADE